MNWGVAAVEKGKAGFKVGPFVLRAETREAGLSPQSGCVPRRGGNWMG